MIEHGLCPTCERHVRLGEESCPFCGGPLYDRKSVTLKTPDEELPAPVYGAPPPGPRPMLAAPSWRPSGGQLALLMAGAMALGFLIARVIVS